MLPGRHIFRVSAMTPRQSTGARMRAPPPDTAGARDSQGQSEQTAEFRKTDSSFPKGHFFGLPAGLLSGLAPMPDGCGGFTRR